MFAVPEGDLPTWEGGAIFLTWAVALVLIGVALFQRRDLGASG